METSIIDNDIVQVHRYENGQKINKLVATLMWGDEVRVSGKDDKNYILDWAQQVWEKQADGISRPHWEFYKTAIPIKTKFRDAVDILKVRVVDVGQGDAAIIETPEKKMIIIDGGQNEALLQYMRKAWSYILREKSIQCNAMIITHGDEDHIVGLNELLSQKRFDPKNHPLNEPMVKVEHIYHNGLVKRVDRKDNDPALFGAAKEQNGKTYIGEIVKDPRNLPDDVLPKIMQEWKGVIAFQQTCNPNLKCQNLFAGDDQAFRFTENEGISIEVLGPLPEIVDGKKMLPWLHTSPTTKTLSGSHTINGNSVMLGSAAIEGLV